MQEPCMTTWDHHSDTGLWEDQKQTNKTKTKQKKQKQKQKQTLLLSKSLFSWLAVGLIIFFLVKNKPNQPNKQTNILRGELAQGLGGSGCWGLKSNSWDTFCGRKERTSTSPLASTCVPRQTWAHKINIIIMLKSSGRLKGLMFGFTRRAWLCTISLLNALSRQVDLALILWNPYHMTNRPADYIIDYKGPVGETGVVALWFK